MKKTKGVHLVEIFLNLVLRMETVKDQGEKQWGYQRGRTVRCVRVFTEVLGFSLLILTTLKFLLFYFIYVSILLACMVIYHVHAWGPLRMAEGVELLKLELQIVMSCRVALESNLGPL